MVRGSLVVGALVCLGGCYNRIDDRGPAGADPSSDDPAMTASTSGCAGRSCDGDDSRGGTTAPEPDAEATSASTGAIGPANCDTDSCMDDCPAGSCAAAGPIRASSDGRSLVDDYGDPFLYVADTVWLAPSRLDQAEVRELLDIRAMQHFSVVQMSVLPFLHLGSTSNAYGHDAVSGRDIGSPVEVGGRTHDDTDPDYDYWDHVDYILTQAAARGLHVTLVPSWYGWEGADWRGYVNEQNASAYGTFIGARLGHHRNILWLLGGDNDPVGEVSYVPEGGSTADVVVATRAMANAIAQAEPVPHLASYHASRRVGSLEFFADDAWHTFASAYGDTTTWDEVAEATGRGVPVVMTEAHYDARNRNPILSERELRTQGWWSLFGGAGFAYGNESIWDLEPGHGSDSGYGGTWQDYLDVPSTRHVEVMATMLEGRWPVQPNDALVLSDLHAGNQRISAATSNAGDRAWVYLPASGAVSVDLAALGGDTVAWRWMDPRDGSTTAETNEPAQGQLTVTAPEGFEDAILVLRRH